MAVGQQPEQFGALKRSPGFVLDVEGGDLKSALLRKLDQIILGAGGILFFG